MSPHHGCSHRASNPFLFLCLLLFLKVDQWMTANPRIMLEPKNITSWYTIFSLKSKYRIGSCRSFGGKIEPQIGKPQIGKLYYSIKSEIMYIINHNAT